jgi:lipid-A-disaccharide synthase
MKIAISAAETSGDLVASSLVSALKLYRPDYEIEGLAGDKMAAAGCKRLWHTDQVNVMGLSEVLKKLPTILRLRRSIIQYFSSNRPDVFIGVDSPDFNFKIERKLKKNGVKTVHFVSPSVWAWRANRIHKIKKSADLMLCLFPLAEKLQPRKNHMPNKQVLLMPGSREAEIKTLLPELLSAAKLMRKKDPEIQFSLSLANERLKDWVEDKIQGLDIVLSSGDAHEKIKNSDLVIVASGTAALEVALLAVPMVVVYKLSKVSYQIVKPLLNTKNVSLPNKILGKDIVPELLQNDVNGQNIFEQAMKLIESDNTKLVKELEKIHGLLNQKASVKSAEAIIEFLDG